MKTYNIRDHVSGNTFDKLGFRISVNGTPKTLTGSAIVMNVRKKVGDTPILTLSVGAGLTIDTVLVHRFFIDEQIVTMIAGCHVFDITITFPDTSKKTYIRGEWQIIGV